MNPGPVPEVRASGPRAERDLGAPGIRAAFTAAEALASERWDLVVIGGGVTGAWIARDAALRGLRVALVEKDDFGAGASSQCFRTIHGGLRYLQHLDIRRTRESIRERSTWLSVAPHLVEPLPFVVPTYRRGLQRRWVLRTALAVADLAGWDRNRGLDASRRLSSSRMLSREECLRLVPEAAAPDLTGGVIFHDAQMYSPDRLVLAILLGASEDGAHVANHVEAEAATQGRGDLRVRCRDGLSGKPLAVRTRTLVNATGARAVDVAERIGIGLTGGAPAQSVALNLMVEGLGHEVAFTTEGEDADPNAHLRMGARRLFVAPWRGRSLIGTAHYHLVPGQPLDVHPYIERFLTEVNAPGTGLRIRPEDVLEVQWGLLPALTGRPGEPVRLLRHHSIRHHMDSGGMPGAFSVTSVKFTTARLVAEQTVDQVCRFLGRRTPPCRTSSSPLPGARFGSWTALREEARAMTEGAIPIDVLEHLLHVYGDRYADVLQLGDDAPDLLRRVQQDACVIGAQLVHAARAELGATVDDLVVRRTELGARGQVSDAARELARLVLAGRSAAGAKGSVSS